MYLHISKWDVYLQKHKSFLGSSPSPRDTAKSPRKRHLGAREGLSWESKRLEYMTGKLSRLRALR